MKNNSTCGPMGVCCSDHRRFISQHSHQKLKQMGIVWMINGNFVVKPFSLDLFFVSYLLKNRWIRKVINLFVSIIIVSRLSFFYSSWVKVSKVELSSEVSFHNIRCSRSSKTLYQNVLIIFIKWNFLYIICRLFVHNFFPYISQFKVNLFWKINRLKKKKNCDYFKKWWGLGKKNRRISETHG